MSKVPLVLNSVEFKVTAANGGLRGVTKGPSGSQPISLNHGVYNTNRSLPAVQAVKNPPNLVILKK